MISADAFPEELGLSKTKVPLASLLVTRERVSAVVAFLSVLYGDRARERQPQQASMRVHIRHLRQKLEKLDLTTKRCGAGTGKCPRPTAQPTTARIDPERRPWELFRQLQIELGCHCGGLPSCTFRHIETKTAPDTSIWSATIGQ